MRRRATAVTATIALAAGTAAVVSSVAAGAGVYAHPGHTAATNKAAAEADAAKLLAAALLPAGATRSATEPAGDGGTLAARPTGPATPNLIDRHQWWIVPGAAGDALTYVEQHVPAGAKQDSTGSSGGSSGPEPSWIGDDWPPVANVLGQRTLLVEIVQLPNDMTGVRLDAQEVWITPRPAAERISAGVTRLRVELTRFGKVTQGPYELGSLRRIRAAAGVIDSLPLFPPGAHSCPNDPGYDLRLQFYLSGRTKPEAVADVDPFGCTTVGLRVGGRDYPLLAGWGFPHGPTATRRLERALGLHLNTHPRPF